MTKNEPTKEQFEELINGVKKIVKIIFKNIITYYKEY